MTNIRQERGGIQNMSCYLAETSECRCLAVFTLHSSPPSLFRPFVHVCVRVPPRHLTHAGAQLERRCVGVSVGTRFARPPAGRGSGSSHSQFAAACLAQLPSSVSSRRAAPNNLDWKNKNWKNRLSVCRSSCQRHHNAAPPPLSLPSVLGFVAPDHPHLPLLRLRPRPSPVQLGQCVCERESNWRRSRPPPPPQPQIDPERASEGLN